MRAAKLAAGVAPVAARDEHPAMLYASPSVSSCLRVCTLVAATVAPLSAQQPETTEPAGMEIAAAVLHLGDTRVESWPAGTPDPVGRELRVKFDARANRIEHCLLLRHHDVDNDWAIRVNGQDLGDLTRGKVFEQHLYLLPPGTLRNGENELVVAPRKKHNDDILIGDVRLVTETQRDFLDLRPVVVRVTEPGSGAALPARLTITDAGGALAEVYYASSPRTAVRPGVVYVADGMAEIELPPGAHKVFASRGFEWGVDVEEFEVRAAQSRTKPLEIRLEIGREVSTPGYIAADTHIHTYTFSGHGDASLDERLITLAAEGVELAVATDHNHHTDYAPRQRELGFSDHYTSVVGNEVTTKNGHFNAFPFAADGKKPPHQVSDWVQLVQGMRDHGAQVVILNHPRWPQIQTGPFGKKHFHLDRTTGAFADGPKITFDAMELVNSTTTMRDPLYAFVDWFALLNHGDRIVAVGTSDSHTVRDPVGQGRTYLVSATDDPAAIDVDAACRAFTAGTCSVSYGIFADVRVGEEFKMGDVAAITGERVRVDLRVASPSWVKPREAIVFLNGIRVAERAVPATDGPTDVWMQFEIDAPPQDAHLVCIVLGPHVAEAYWDTDQGNDYTLAATNPVWLDVDGDGAWTSPRHHAEKLLATAGQDPVALADALQACDDAVAIQALALVLEGDAERGAHRVAATAARLGRAAITDWVESR